MSFLLRGTGIDHPKSYYFDEVYYVYTAQLLAQGDARGWEWWHENPEGFAIEWTHPPIAKLLIAASIRLFGDHPTAWRLPGALAVALGSGVMFLLGRAVFRATGWGLVAAALFSLDLLPFAAARIATPEALLYLFTPLVFLAATLAARTVRIGWLAALGLAGGALIATKWNGVVTLGLAVLLAASGLASAVWSGRRPLRRTVLAGVGCLVVLPLAVYLLAFAPFFTSGHDLKTFKELHQQMYWYHARLDATHPYQSRFWEWPLVYRSIWYFTDTDAATGKVANIYALGNPAVWWGGAAAMFWLLVEAIRTRGQNRLAVTLVVAYLLLWLPYALSPRVMFLYHFLPASLIAMLGVVALLREAQATRRGSWIIAGYLALVLGVFLTLYPLAAGSHISPAHRDALLWLPGWR